MPKINVYLPDDLAEAVRDARLPVSAVCQRALEDALRRTTAATETARGFDHSDETAYAWVEGRVTPRVREAMHLAHLAASDRKVPYIGTEHVLLGVLDEQHNMAIRVIESLDVELDDLREELDAAIAQTERRRSPSTKIPAPTPGAKEVFRLAATESLRLGHNYIGCEHVLLGLIAEEDGLAGQVLRSMGLDITVTRRAVVTALSGFVFGREQASATTADAPAAARPGIDDLLRQIVERLDRVEQKLGE